MTRIYTFFDAKLQKILLTQYIFEKNSFFFAIIIVIFYAIRTFFEYFLASITL